MDKANMLTPDEIETAARTLCQSSGVDDWDKISGRNKAGYKMVVSSMWGYLAQDAPKNPTMWAVFMAWMGDDSAMKAVAKAMSDAPSSSASAARC